VHRFVSRTESLLGFSRLTVSCLFQEWSTTQRTSSYVDNSSLTFVMTFILPKCIEALLLCTLETFIVKAIVFIGAPVNFERGGRRLLGYISWSRRN
jgi:hypothetical protein